MAEWSPGEFADRRGVLLPLVCIRDFEAQLEATHAEGCAIERCACSSQLRSHCLLRDPVGAFKFFSTCGW